MAAARRGEDGAKRGGDGGVRPHPVVTGVLLLVVVGVLSLFPIALYANVMAMSDGYRASHGEAGTPGTATVESVVDGRGGQVCRGTFAGDDSGSGSAGGGGDDGGTVAVDVRIEVPGGCEVGQVVEVRLMEGRDSIFTGYGEPRAWAEGSNDWAGYIGLVVLFGLLSLPLVLLVVMIVTRLFKLMFLPRDAPKV